MEKPSLKSVKDEDVLAYISFLEKEVADLSAFRQKISTNLAYPTFEAIFNQIQSFNEQLTIRTVEMPHPETGKPIDVNAGFIDLFADKDSKEFDRAWKYFLEADQLIEKMQKLIKMMTPEEQKAAEKTKADAALGIAEKLALKSKPN